MKPGVPDATAQCLWPQSPHCLTELPRLWDVVMAIESLISPALPLLKGQCWPTGKGRSAGTAGPLQKPRERPFFYLGFWKNFATPSQGRTPGLVAGSGWAGNYRRPD